MTGHRVRAYRRPSGWILWYAACADCTYREDGKGREHAEWLADEHYRATDCTCWDSLSMEFSPEPCDVCKETA